MDLNYWRKITTTG